MKSMFAFAVAAVLASTFVFSGCEKKEPTLGEKLEQAADATKDAAAKAVDETKDAAAKTADATKDAVKDAAKAVEDAAK